MTAANPGVTLPGAVNSGGSDRALYLKLFSGEVLAAWAEKNIMRPLITMRTIPFGKTAQFPVFGKAVAVVHSKGNNIFEDGGLNRINTNERTISVDKPIHAPILIHDMDERMNAYETRAPYANQLALSLSYAFDTFSLAAVWIASSVPNDGSGLGAALVTGEPAGGIQATNSGGNAVASANLTGGGGGVGGFAYVDAALTSSGPALAKALFTIATAMNIRDVPADGRNCVVTPGMFLNLIKDPSLYVLTGAVGINPVVQTIAPGGTVTAGALTYGSIESMRSEVLNSNPGAYARPGSNVTVAGITVFWSNHIPNSNQTGAAATGGTQDLLYAIGTDGQTYRYDYRNTVGLVWHSTAIGGLILQDIALETEWRMEYQAHAMLAKMLCGFNFLQPGSAFRLATA